MLQLCRTFVGILVRAAMFSGLQSAILTGQAHAIPPAVAVARQNRTPAKTRLPRIAVRIRKPPKGNLYKARFVDPGNGWYFRCRQTVCDGELAKQTKCGDRESCNSKWFVEHLTAPERNGAPRHLPRKALLLQVTSTRLSLLRTLG